MEPVLLNVNTSLGIDLGQRGLQAHRAVAVGQRRHDGPAAITQAQRQWFSASGGPRERSSLSAGEILAARPVSAGRNEYKTPLGCAHIDMVAARPEIRHLVAAPGAFLKDISLVIPADF